MSIHINVLSEIVDISKIKLIHHNKGKQNSKKFKGIEKDGEKTCNRCNKSKLLNMFSNSVNHIGGKYSFCKACQSIHHKSWYAKSIGRTLEEIGIKGKIIDGKKKCSVCNEWKLISSFNKFVRAKYKLNSQCKKCQQARLFKETRRIKLKCMIGYGGKCVCCGDNQIEMLTIEHIRFKGYKLIYDHTTVLMRKLILLGFPKGYEIRCYGCNLSSAHMPCVHSKEYKLYYDKYIKSRYYERQEELDELENKWEMMKR